MPTPRGKNAKADASSARAKTMKGGAVQPTIVPLKGEELRLFKLLNPHIDTKSTDTSSSKSSKSSKSS
jgi:hypothetical protein